jgi:hypothetical protein
MAVAHLEDWHHTAGTIDVVLFPRAWEQFQDSVKEGVVLFVSGKADAARGDMQIICDSIRQDWNFVTPEDQPLLPAEQDVPHWALDYDEETGEPPHLPEEPEPELVAAVAPATQGGAAVPTPAVVPQIRPDIRPLSLDAPPAWMDDDESDLPDSTPPPDAPPSQPERWLMIYFHRSDDPDKDRRRLTRLHGILISYPGQDRFTIVIEDGRQSLKMEFPNHTTAYCEDLHRDLLAVIGDESNIQVFDRPD